MVSNHIGNGYQYYILHIGTEYWLLVLAITYGILGIEYYTLVLTQALDI